MKARLPVPVPVPGQPLPSLPAQQALALHLLQEHSDRSRRDSVFLPALLQAFRREQAVLLLRQTPDQV